MNIPEDTIIEKFIFSFGDQIEADIKVCSGQNNCFIDPVLFEDGFEVGLLEPEFDLLGEYVFEFEGKEYVAVLEL